MKFIMELQNMNFMGPKAANMDTLGYHIMNICTPSFNVKKAHWTWQQRSKELTAVSVGKLNTVLVFFFKNKTI